MADDETYAAIYARVSTDDQNVDRQLAEARDELFDRFGVSGIDEYPEVVSGTTTADGREVYNELLDDIESGMFDVVAVHEISRLSRLGSTEIHRFIQHCLENDTGVVALDVGLEIHVDDNELQQTIYTMIARLMGDLAEIEHTQKMQRIESGIRAAQEAGKWTGRPPRGFTVGEEGHLCVDAEEYLHTREALARAERGEPFAEVAEKTGVPESTLRSLHNDRRELYLAGETDDERVDAALQAVRPIDDLRGEEVDVQAILDRLDRLENEVGLK